MTSTATAKTKSRKAEVAKYQMYIDGKFVDAADGKTFEVYDPSTEGVVATCPAGKAGRFEEVNTMPRARLQSARALA